MWFCWFHSDSVEQVLNLNSIGFLELQDILIKKGYRIDTLTQFKSVTRKGKPRYQMQVMPFLIFSAVMYVIHVQRLTVCRFVQLTGTVTHCQWVAADNFAAQLSSVFKIHTCYYMYMYQTFRQGSWLWYIQGMSMYTVCCNSQSVVVSSPGVDSQQQVFIYWNTLQCI